MPAKRKTKAKLKQKPQNQCSSCRELGHNRRGCPYAPKELHVTLGAAKSVKLEPLRGKQVQHLAYDPETWTLRLEFKGTFTTHWYAYAQVPPEVVGQILESPKPDIEVQQQLTRYARRYARPQPQIVAVTKRTP